MHTYCKSKYEQLWTVGYFKPTSASNGTLDYEWYPLTDFDKERDAMERVNYLNGGNAIRWRDETTHQVRPRW